MSSAKHLCCIVGLGVQPVHSKNGAMAVDGGVMDNYTNITAKRRKV